MTALDVGPHMAPDVLYNRGPSTRDQAMVQVGVLGRRQVRDPAGQCPGPRGPVGGLMPVGLPEVRGSNYEALVPAAREEHAPIRQGVREA
eukprot:10632589-Alexandrium_andersonii.AAC.1